MSFLPLQRNEFKELIFENNNKRARLYLDDSGLATEVDNSPLPTLIADSSKLNFKRARFEKEGEQDTYFDMYVDPVENNLIFEDKNGLKKNVGGNSYPDLYVDNLYSTATDLKFFALDHTYDFLKYSNTGGYLRFGPDMVDGWFNGSSFMLVDKLAHSGGTPLTISHGTLAIVGKADTYGVGLSEGILFRDLAGTDYAGLDFRSDDDDYRFLGGKTVPSENTLLRLVVRDNATLNGDHLLLDPSGALLACPYESIWFNTGDKTNKLSFVRGGGTGINTLPDMTKATNGDILEINANAFNTTWSDTAVKFYLGVEDNSGSQPVGNTSLKINDGNGNFLDTITISGVNKTINIGANFICNFLSTGTHTMNGILRAHELSGDQLSITGTANITQTLNVGDSVSANSLTTTNGVSIGTDLSCGNAIVQKDLTCEGATVNKDLEVIGLSTLNGDTVINGDLIVHGATTNAGADLSAILSTNQSITVPGAQSFTTKVAFDVVQWDIENNFDTSSHEFVTAHDGYYRFQITVALRDNAPTLTLIDPIKCNLVIVYGQSTYYTFNMIGSKVNSTDGRNNDFKGSYVLTLNLPAGYAAYCLLNLTTDGANSDLYIDKANTFFQVREV